MGADFSKYKEVLRFAYNFSRQTISKDSKSSRRKRVGTRNTRDEGSGTTGCSLASAALEF
jgi:hypothetical protein